MKLIDKLFGKKKKKEFPPVPKWKPDYPIDIELIFEKVKYYMGGKLQFAIFKNGTVTFFPKKVENIEQSAKDAVDNIFHYHVDFKPKAMDDGNYLIEYLHQAFTIVFKSEIEQYWDDIEVRHMDGVCRAEVLINSQGQANVFDKTGKICLFGRTKLFMDAQDPVVVRTFSPE